MKDQSLLNKREQLIKMDTKAQSYASSGFIGAASHQATLADLIRQDITEFYSELFGPKYDAEHYEERLAA